MIFFKTAWADLGQFWADLWKFWGRNFIRRRANAVLPPQQMSGRGGRVEGSVENKALPLLQGTRETPLPFLMLTNCAGGVGVGWGG